MHDPIQMPASHQQRSLLLLGAVWFLVGLNTYLNPPALPNETFVLEYLPTWLRASLWFVTGTLAMLFSSWPADRRNWGFVALLIPAALRALCYLWAAFEWTWTALFREEIRSEPKAWLFFVVWGLVTMFVLHESATIDPPTPPDVPPPVEDL